MKLSNKVKEEIRDLAFIMVILLLFILCFSVVTAQNMMTSKLDIPVIELNLDKPQNKFVAKKQVNNRALVFISGTALTTIGTVQMIRTKNSHFRFDRPKGAIPINPHNLLIGLGLFTMSISIVI
tara:strand:- start:10 stop:381 length:372 start_codon:yes stop_codon:yes gene_type:complete